MIDKLYKDKYWLHDKYYNQVLFQSQIAEICKVKQKAIWYWMKKFGFKSRNRGFKKGNIPHHKGKHFIHSGSFKTGQISWNKGKKMPLSMRLKLSEIAKKRIGKLAANWRGGKSDFKESIYANHRYSEWRIKIFKRDNYTCQLCGYDKGGILQAHHIKTVKQIIKDNNLKDIYGIIKCKELWNIYNGITLCQKCHEKIFGKEGYYKDNFLNLIQ